MQNVRTFQVVLFDAKHILGLPSSITDTKLKPDFKDHLGFMRI